MASSTFDNSSLYIVPSGIKAGTVFPIKPLGTANLDFTRANDTATRVNSAGLIEKVRTNLVLRSEQFDDAAWSKLNTTITADDAVAPDGTTTADKLVEDSSTSVHIAFQNTTIISGTTYTASVFAKSTERFLQLSFSLSLFGGNAFANFDVQNGVLGTVGSSASAKIEQLSNGWYRCTVTATATAAGSGGFSTNLIQAANSPRSQSYLGDGTSGVFIWGAQLEAGSVATPYIPTTTAAVSVGMLANIPRIDYTGGGCGKLLLEPQRTNTLIFSEQLNNAAWGTTNAAITANQAVSPDGFINADKLIDDSTSGLHRTLPTVGSVAANTTYVLSCFAKKAELDYVVLSAGGSSLTGSGGSGADRIASVNLNNGAIVTNNYNVSSVDYGNGWYRISIRLTTDVDGGSFFPYIATSQNGTTVSYVGSGQGIFLYGAQLELGSYATSYIPTLGASVTRSADAAFKETISTLLGAEGTIYFETTYFPETNIGGGERFVYLQGASSTTFIRLWQDFVAGQQRFRYLVRTNDVQQVNLQTAVPVSTTAPSVIKWASVFENNRFVTYINGVKLHEQLSATAPTLQEVSFNNTAQTIMPLSAFAFYQEAFTDVQLAQLTTL